jgi:hypothetical protein
MEFGIDRDHRSLQDAVVDIDPGGGEKLESKDMLRHQNHFTMRPDETLG